MQSAISYALASLLLVAIASTVAYLGIMRIGHDGGSLLGLFVVSLLFSALPSLFAFLLFRVGTTVSRRHSDSRSAFAIGIAFSAGASILAIGVGLSLQSLRWFVCVLLILNCVFAYSAPFTFGRPTASASSTSEHEPIVPEGIAKNFSTASFSLFLVILIGTVLGILVAHAAGGGGHPPGGLMVLILVAFGIFVLAPLGVALGSLGKPQRNGKALIGLLGNLLLFLLALWFSRRIY